MCTPRWPVTRRCSRWATMGVCSAQCSRTWCRGLQGRVYYRVLSLPPVHNSPAMPQHRSGLRCPRIVEMRPTADHARTEMRVKSVMPGGLDFQTPLVQIKMYSCRDRRGTSRQTCTPARVQGCLGWPRLNASRMAFSSMRRCGRPCRVHRCINVHVR